MVNPESQMTPGDLSVLRTHKEALLSLLECWEERTAIIEYDGGLPREKAERLAWDCLCGTAVASTPDLAPEERYRVQ